MRWMCYGQMFHSILQTNIALEINATINLLYIWTFRTAESEEKIFPIHMKNADWISLEIL